VVDQVGYFSISNKTARTSSAAAEMVTVEVVGLDIAVGYREVAILLTAAQQSQGGF
jgi:hypothetical protein